MLDHVQKVLRRHVADVVQLLHHLVQGHRADRHRRGIDDRLANGVDVAAGRKVHHRVGAEVHRRVQLFQLALDVARDRRVADVGVDLRAGGDADAHRLEPLLQVHLVGRNDHPAAGHFAANQLGLESFALGDVFHFGRDNAAAGHFDLSHDCD